MKTSDSGEVFFTLKLAASVASEDRMLYPVEGIQMLYTGAFRSQLATIMNEFVLVKAFRCVHRGIQMLLDLLFSGVSGNAAGISSATSSAIPLQYDLSGVSLSLITASTQVSHGIQMRMSVALSNL